MMNTLQYDGATFHQHELTWVAPMESFGVIHTN